MSAILRPSLVEITLDHLRRGITEGRWKDHLPGVRPLADELAVSKETLRAALAQLEHTGEVRCLGAGRHRRIMKAPTPTPIAQKVLRVAILLRLPLEAQNSISQSLIQKIIHEIGLAGHHAFISDKYVKQPGPEGRTLKKLVAASRADAWIAYGPSFEVLAWFVRHGVPIFSIGGHPIGMSIPCARSDLDLAMNDAVDALVAHRHRRIVLITTEKWLRPRRNGSALAFCAAMERHGLAVSDYNLPDWEKSAEGLEILLRTLFHTTPPTALIILEPAWTAATLGFLLRHGLRIPEHVSIINMLPDPVLKLWRPRLAHFHWRTTPHIQHAMKWLQSLVERTAFPPLKQVPVTFVADESIGPVTAESRTLQA
jgi:DNA-binding LacI/PurR family transcriptional regulator